MAWKAYYRQVAALSTSRPWSITRQISTAVSLTLGSIIAAQLLFPSIRSYIPTSGVRVADVGALAALFLLLSFLALIVIRFVFHAPYQIHREQEHEVKNLKETHRQTEDVLHQQIITLKDQLDTRAQLREQTLHDRAVLQAHGDAIADFVEEGKRIQELFVKGEAFMTIDEVEAWFCEVQSYLEENLSRAVVSQWKNDDGLFIPESPHNFLRMVRVLKPGEVPQPAFALHTIRTQVYKTLTFRIKRLYELLTKLQDRLLNE